MPPILKEKDKRPVMCGTCKGEGRVHQQVCPDCLNVGFTTAIGTVLDEDTAIRYLKARESHYRDLARKKHEKAERLEQTVKAIEAALNPQSSPEVYKPDGQGRIYHGD